LSGFLSASTVAIGYCRHAGSKRTRIVSISGATEIDRSGEQAQQFESALNETLVRNTITTLPDVSTDPRSMKLAHRQLIESHPDSHLVSAPLTTGRGETIGAWLCLIPAQDNQRETIQFAKVASRYLADALDVSSRAAAGPVARLKQQTIGWASGKVSKILLASMAVIALILIIPVPHRVDCRCTLEPTVRRFAVAPHDGILLESFVKPGDLVSAGQIVARMDDRELNLELSGLIAEREAAIKKRDVSLSARDAAATKISEFEIEQLDSKIQLVRFRLENLEIKTEIDGIVLQGNLEDARGAPVRRGDVLAEISPLEQLKLEVDVHETNVNYIEAGQSTSIVLDGSLFNSIKGEIDSVHPMAEIRNDENVFVADVIIPNDDQQLRPGMQGRAKVNAGLRPVGWILFHRPLERAYSIFR
jgi:multidrug efflux pump subunit AcrA (membrane-fusion protein)